MNAIDAPDPPRVKDAESVARYYRFWNAPKRVKVALQQPLLTGAFQYNDSTPALAVAALRYATGKGALEFAEEALFLPMGFRNYEWMHQDSSGLDNAGYGLRLRPIDMQKFGILYLNHGAWNGGQLVSSAWVERSFEAWNRSKPNGEPDYGWFWWRYDFGSGWIAHVASGWKGQRIAVIPDQNIVLTMTGCIEDGSEHEVFSKIVAKFLKPAVERGADSTPAAAAELTRVLAEVQRSPSRFGDFIEYRMVPSVAAKAVRKPLVP